MASVRLPEVSFVMPVLNDVRHLGAAVDSVLAQEGIGEKELFLVLGNSVDGTNAVAASLAAAHSEIRIIANPRDLSSVAMNVGIRAATHDVIVRVDAHSVLPATYARDAIATLSRTGAVNVGGRMRAEGSNAFERAVALAYNSRGGLGGAVYHLGGKSGPAESAYLGVFRRVEILEAGGFDETLGRGSDWELNSRLRQRGLLVWFDASLEVLYKPRSSLRGLAAQFYATGSWRGDLIRRLRGRMSPRYFAPPGLLVALAVSWAAALVLAVVGSARPWEWVVVAVPSFVYCCVLAIAVVMARIRSLKVGAWFLMVLPVMHLWWGAGCLWGMFRPPERRSARRAPSAERPG